MAKDDVPRGTVEQMPPWESKVFFGTIRDWSIYVPAKYTGDQPAALMVFQDGERMRDVKGRWRIPVVFDNLIAREDMPPTIAVFINPGHDKSKPQQRNRPSNRSYEYDSLGDRYVRFLQEEIIPEVEKRYRISPDPEMRAIGGSSSGAICAFTVAWERPDLFRKVYSIDAGGARAFVWQRACALHLLRRLRRQRVRKQGQKQPERLNETSSRNHHHGPEKRGQGFHEWILLRHEQIAQTDVAVEGDEVHLLFQFGDDRVFGF